MSRKEKKWLSKKGRPTVNKSFKRKDGKIAKEALTIVTWKEKSLTLRMTLAGQNVKTVKKGQVWLKYAGHNLLAQRTRH